MSATWSNSTAHSTWGDGFITSTVYCWQQDVKYIYGVWMVLEGLGICLYCSVDPWTCCDAALWCVVLALACVTLQQLRGTSLWCVKAQRCKDHILASAYARCAIAYCDSHPHYTQIGHISECRHGWDQVPRQLVGQSAGEGPKVCTLWMINSSSIWWAQVACKALANVGQLTESHIDTSLYKICALHDCLYP